MASTYVIRDPDTFRQNICDKLSKLFTTNTDTEDAKRTTIIVGNIEKSVYNWAIREATAKQLVRYPMGQSPLCAIVCGSAAECLYEFVHQCRIGPTNCIGRRITRNRRKHDTPGDESRALGRHHRIEKKTRSFQISDEYGGQYGFIQMFTVQIDPMQLYDSANSKCRRSHDGICHMSVVRETVEVLIC